MKKFISWRRVSTQKQNKSGLGLAAQKEIIGYFINSEKGELIADYEEAYTGKDLEGCKELQKAITHCKETGATLIIAKTDRFRNTVEALQIYDEMQGNIYFCDLPHTDKFTLTLFFALAEREALLVSIRTKQALAVKKSQGVTLGRPKGCEPSRNAIESSRSARKTTAKGNPHNVAFKRYMELYEEQHGRITPNTGIKDFTAQLNRLGYKTATGLDFNDARAWVMLKKIRELYSA